MFDWFLAAGFGSESKISARKGGYRWTMWCARETKAFMVLIKAHRVMLKMQAMGLDTKTVSGAACR